MKKSLLVTLALSLVLVAAGCSKTTENTTEEVATEVEDATEAVEEDAAEAEDTAEADTAEAEAEAETENAATAEGVMSYADYVGKTTVLDRLPSTPRIRTVLSSFTTFPALRKIMTSLFPEPKSKLPVSSPNGPVK